MATKPRTLAYEIATRLSTLAYLNRQNEAKFEIVQRNVEEIEQLCREFMPSGSGFDSGTTLDFDRSTPATLVFNTGFHHMNGDTGMYTGWTEHTIKATANFDGTEISASGRNKDGVKEYVVSCFHTSLEQIIDVEWHEATKHFTFKLHVEERA
jgi:hypothetical protein